MKKKTFLLTILVVSLTLSSCSTTKDSREIELNSYLNKGISSFNKKDYVEAEEFFSNALDLNESDEIILKNEIITLNKLDRNDEALILAKKALVLYPDSIKFNLIKARLLRTLSMNEESIATYKEVLKIVNFEESYHKEYVEYLTTLLPSSNKLVTDSVVDECNFLLEQQMCTQEALIALCTMDKTSLLYSAMLKDLDSSKWEKIYKAK